MTKTDQYIRHALQLGWRVTDDGIVYNSKGFRRDIRKRGKISDPVRKQYPRICLSMNDKQFPVEVHKLAAAYFLGEQYWENKKRGLQVRHLDGNLLNLSKTNIIMGTCSENNLDKPASIRKRAARISRKASAAIKISCPHCLKVVDKLTLHRWHLSQCKYFRGSSPASPSSP